LLLSLGRYRLVPLFGLEPPITTNYDIIGLRYTPSTKTIRAHIYRQLAPAGRLVVVAGKAAARGSTADTHLDPAAADSQTGGAVTASREPVNPSPANSQVNKGISRARHLPAGSSHGSPGRCIRHGIVSAGEFP